MIFKPKHQIKNPWWVKTIPHIIIVSLLIDVAIIYVLYRNIDMNVVRVLTTIQAFWILSFLGLGYRIEKDKMLVDWSWKILLICATLAFLGMTLFYFKLLIDSGFLALAFWGHFFNKKKEAGIPASE